MKTHTTTPKPHTRPMKTPQFHSPISRPTISHQAHAMDTARAERIARANAEGDDWTYRVRELAPGRAVIDMYDDAGDFVGTL